MKVIKLHIQDFRNHVNSVLELAPFTGIRGGNFQGKSSIGQSISMLLTPSTDALDSQGRGFISKIRRGATKAVIVGDIQGKSKLVQKTVTLNTNTTGRTDPSKCLDDPEWHTLPFENLLKANRDALLVALNTSRFLEMDEKDQKNLLAKLILRSAYEFPKDTVDAVNRVLGEGAVDFSGEQFAVIDKAYKLLYAERQIINRQVKDFSVPDPLGATGLTSESLQAHLTAARDARQRILTEKDAAVKKSSDSDNERTRVQTKLENIQTQIKEEKDKLIALGQNLLIEADHKKMTKVAAGKEDGDKLTRERGVIAVTVTDVKRELERLGNLLAQFSADGAKCPTCDQEVDKRVIEALLKQAQQELTEAQERDTAILRTMQALGDVDGAVAALARHDKAVAERTAINAVIADKEKLAKTGKAKLDSMGAKVDVAGEFTEPLAKADVEISRITEQLRPVIAAEEREKEITEKMAQLEALRAKAATVDDLTKFFDKDGIKAKLLKDNIGEFEGKLNSVFAVWGYHTALSIEPYELTVTDARGVTTPVKELSGSEELLFSIAFQCAVSHVSGVGIVVADRMDTFLPEQRSKVNKCLYGMVSDGTLEQAIVVTSDQNETAPAMPNAAFYMVENGTVRRLGK